MTYTFTTWAKALEFFTREIWPSASTAREYADLTLADAFEIWSEDEGIIVEEARDTQDSDDYDSLTSSK